jgi:hypothetical protein
VLEKIQWHSATAKKLCHTHRERRTPSALRSVLSRINNPAVAFAVVSSDCCRPVLSNQLVFPASDSSKIYRSKDTGIGWHFSQQS